MFQKYGDVLTVAQVAEALGLCEGSVYKLEKSSVIGCRRVGRKILIPKICLIDYVNSARYTVLGM